jgi:hypothetical protein
VNHDPEISACRSRRDTRDRDFKLVGHRRERSFDAEIGKRAFLNRRRAESRQVLMIGPTAMLIEKPAEATRQSLFDVGTVSTSPMAGLAGSLDPNPRADMASAMQRNSSISARCVWPEALSLCRS